MERATSDQALHKIWRYEGGTFSESLDSVLREHLLSVYLEGSLLVKLICIPEYLEELALGYLFSEGFIACIDDVAHIAIEGASAYVKLAEAPEEAVAAEEGDVVTTDSGDFVKNPFKAKRPLDYSLARSADWDPEVVLKNANVLLEKSEIFKTTGNVHSVMVCQGAEVLYFCEDIGRYNAFDKCLGRALKDRADLGRACVYTSGRIPSSVALKAVHAGIPMIVSRSAPTDATLEIAQRYGLTVIGFARGSKFSVYVPDLEGLERVSKSVSKTANNY
ncbi:MAG: formate dehydrogenase accessory sulfurtransferase FdhD [Eggerthellaceae bacterium]|nr:formate dehydrogenase accessory sulfurtransferase FdhD [Eggerthellaceae bacterium]